MIKSTSRIDQLKMQKLFQFQQLVEECHVPMKSFQELLLGAFRLHLKISQGFVDKGFEIKLTKKHVYYELGNIN